MERRASSTMTAFTALSTSFSCPATPSFPHDIHFHRLAVHKSLPGCQPHLAAVAAAAPLARCAGGGGGGRAQGKPPHLLHCPTTYLSPLPLRSPFGCAGSAPRTVLVVGGGPAGLLAAAYLARRGCYVHVVDKRAHPAADTSCPDRAFVMGLNPHGERALRGAPGTGQPVMAGR